MDVFWKDLSTKEAFLKQSSKFNLDLTPRVLLGADALVETLIQSGVGRYFDCTSIESTFVVSDQQLFQVPCSKTDIFKTKLLHMKEKRLLMKFLQYVADYGEQHIDGQNPHTTNERDLAVGRSLKRPQNKSVTSAQIRGEDLEQSFSNFLLNQFQLSVKLQKVILYAIALQGTTELTTKQGLGAVYTYVSSIGRFAQTAYLVPLCGISELGQAFCRLSAVYQGTFILRAPTDGLRLHINDEGDVCDGMAQGKNVLKSKWVVSEPEYFPTYCAKDLTKPSVLRRICLVTKSMHADMDRMLVVIPPDTVENSAPIHVLQLDFKTQVCPEGTFLWHMTTLGTDRRVLDQALTLLLRENEQLWGVTYDQPYFTTTSDNLPPNVLLVDVNGSPQVSLQLEQERNEAQRLFEKICPSQIFLPKSQSAVDAESQEQKEEEQQASILTSAQEAITAHKIQTAVDPESI